MDNKSLDELFSTLTGQGEDASTAREKASAVTSKQDISPKKEEKQEVAEEKFCSKIDPELMWKVRTIAAREGLQIKEVIGAAIKKAIGSYEQKHGTIQADTKDS